MGGLPPLKSGPDFLLCHCHTLCAYSLVFAECMSLIAFRVELGTSLDMLHFTVVNKYFQSSRCTEMRAL